ncbi:MAG: hypothetical protein E6K48_10125 [Gammaproteobacteria bacterium]|nr:MAG: hypothetical protein E6K48_10125 [Gammaproteobacteria bacterium]
MNAPLTVRIAEEHVLASRALAPPPALAARRRAALAALAAQGLPTSRDENWKYANLRPLERLRFAPAPGTASLAAVDLPAAISGFARYVFVDGAFAPALSAPLDATTAWVAPLAAAADASRTAAVPSPRPASADERFALLNEAFATDGVEIRVAEPSAAGARLELVFVARAESEEGASYPRVELRLESGTQLTLIERHVSAGAAASATLAEEASYRLFGIATGALSSRSTLAVQLAGERAELTLAVLSLGDRQQVLDVFAPVEHAAPRARTEQIFRGISAGRARVAFNGKIVVAPEARGTDSRQSLRGLLAGPEAEIDVRPQLEIHTDEVRCSHGATAGKLDDNMLFYLLSRGLPPEVAQRLLKWAFLEDVVARIGVPELRRDIEKRLALQVPELEPHTEAV